MWRRTKDITLANIAIKLASDRQTLTKSWRVALFILNGFRRYLVIPLMLTSISNLVLYKGGDALSVLLNTVAVLFLLDVDNIIFSTALSDKVRAQVEEAGRVQVTAAQATRMARTKLAHIVLVIGFVLVSVSTRLTYLKAGALAFVVMWAGGMVEGCMAADSTSEFGVWFVSRAAGLAVGIGIASALIMAGLHM